MDETCSCIYCSSTLMALISIHELKNGKKLFKLAFALLALYSMLGIKGHLNLAIVCNNFF